jgi:hypothetical protein
MPAYRQKPPPRKGSTLAFDARTVDILKRSFSSDNPIRTFLSKRLEPRDYAALYAKLSDCQLALAADVAPVVPVAERSSIPRVAPVSRGTDEQASPEAEALATGEPQTIAANQVDRAELERANGLPFPPAAALDAAKRIGVDHYGAQPRPKALNRSEVVEADFARRFPHASKIGAR